MKPEHKSQLAKDLSDALFACKLRDDLYALSEDSRVPAELKRPVRDCYLKSVVVLVCALQDSAELRQAMGAEK